MLRRPVEPQPVKNSFPPALSALSTVSWIAVALPDFTNSVKVRSTSLSTSNSCLRPALMFFFAVSLRFAVTGCDDSVVRAPSLN